jgi:hypothetical protein
MKIKNFDYINYKDKELCKKFLVSNKRFVLGRDKWAKSIISKIKINGIKFIK